MSKSQMGLVSPSNYLTRMAREADTRKWPRRDCELCVGMLYAEKGLRRIREGKIWLHNISEGGAAASCRLDIPPDHFYIYFGDYQYFIGCTLVGLGNGTMHLKFLKEQPTEFVDILSRISDAFEFRGEIKLSLYGLPDRSEKTFSLSALRQLDS